jgi:predicted TIM-barrel fold metal-dependent hydrolase
MSVELAPGVKVIDADTHMTEAHDLFTRRAPAAHKDRVPRVVEIDGRPTWIVEDGIEIGFAGGGAVIDRDGNKFPFQESMTQWDIERVHVAAYDPKVRLEMMDESGVWAQVIFPNTIGLAGQDLQSMKDPELRLLCIEIYNDAAAELQDESGTRLLTMPLLPAWDVAACVREAERVAGLGLRGINMTSDPQDLGGPDLASTAWDPLWDVCEDLALPVHFHIGASLTAMNFYGEYFWESQHEYVKPAIGGTMLFINNARVLVNTLMSGMFDRHPRLKMVSVESGVGWVPFILETVDYELVENAPEQFAQLGRRPSEYFRDHWYTTFWFERNRGDLQGLIDAVGEDNVLFETDFPHPTCLYPKPLDVISDQLSSLKPQTRAKLLGGNAAELYRL